ncbi:hypothetical protein RND81_06G121900 [Saponaria officinalis]|uniref:MADS-box domain-containing protein n=1 Tax=Saponaria officinalis TaxID=3572 RepID=A0AAW1KAU8_SAPOF
MARRRSNNGSYIVNDSARRLTYRKRSKSLLKKIEEITTLCDVKGCAVFYSNSNRNSNEMPQTFPSNLIEDLSVVSDFYEISPGEQSKNMLNQEEYLIDRINKCCDQFKKLQSDNLENRLTGDMHEFLADKNKNFDDFSLIDLIELSKLVDRNFKEINNLIEVNEANNFPHSLPIDTNISRDNAPQSYDGVINPTIEMESNLNVVMPNAQGQIPYGVMSNNGGDTGVVIGNNTDNNNNNYGDNNCNVNYHLNAPGVYQWHIDNFNINAPLNAPEAGQWLSYLANNNALLNAPRVGQLYNNNFNINAPLNATCGADQGYCNDFNINASVNAPRVDQYYNNNFNINVPLNAPGVGQWYNNNLNINAPLKAPEEDQWPGNNVMNDLLSAPRVDQWPNYHVNINTSLNAPEGDQWYVDMINESHDAGVGPSNRSFAGVNGVGPSNR